MAWKIPDVLEDKEVRDVASRLSAEQLQLIVQEYQGRNSKYLLDSIRKELKDDFQNIIRGLTEIGFYEREFEVLPGFKCAFRTLLDDQWKEAWDFYSQIPERSSQMVALNQLNRRLTVHGISLVNGQPFAGMSLPKNYAELVISGAEKVEDLIKEVADKRHKALSVMPISLVDKIVNYHRAFSTIIDELINGDTNRDLRDSELKSS